MRNIKDKLLTLLLFVIAIAWGNIWTTEILSCPEWWFIGVNALLFGVGIYLIGILPEQWRTLAPGWVLALVLLIDIPVLSSVLLPLAGGCWYGSNIKLYRSWQISRIFCAGLLIGGIFAGIIREPEFLSPLLAVLVMLHCGLQSSWLHLLEMGLLAAFYLWGQPPAPVPPPPPEKCDAGTVITAFSQVPESAADGDLPRVVFVGGNEESLFHAGSVLNPASNMVFLPELPGTVPPNSSLIIVNRLPETGNSGIAALSRSLVPGGVLVVPVEYCRMLPAESWYILPGSDERYAAMSPGRKLEWDPDELDSNLHRHFSRTPDVAPLQGALAGLLVDFRVGKVPLEAPGGKTFFRFLYYTVAAGFVLTVIWLLRMKNGGRDNLRILLNCTGFSLLTAFLMPVALAGLPMIPAITALMTVIALIWVFRRPVKWAAAAQVPPRVFLGKTIRNWNSRLAVSGIIAFIALIWSYGGGWFPALTALISGGYFFAELDGELCGKRESAVEPIRFLGIAIGAFAANYMHYSGVSFWGFFAVVIALRGWSFFRS